MSALMKDDMGTVTISTGGRGGHIFLKVRIPQKLLHRPHNPDCHH
jgi:hypothetical protein